jgi:uncharacterized membrane protein YuzA (DUF378 family)
VYKLNKLSVLDWVAMVLVIVGGLNWGLALWDVNLVTMIFGGIASWIYALVGLAALYMIWLSMKLAKK